MVEITLTGINPSWDSRLLHYGEGISLALRSQPRIAGGELCPGHLRSTQAKPPESWVSQSSVRAILKWESPILRVR